MQHDKMITAAKVRAAKRSNDNARADFASYMTHGFRLAAVYAAERVATSGRALSRAECEHARAVQVLTMRSEESALRQVFNR